MDTSELRADIEEAERLAASASQPNVQKLLQEKANQWAQLVKKLEVERLQEQKAANSAEIVSSSDQKVYTITLRTYSWGESEKFMKLYIEVPGLTPQDADKISSKFAANGFVLTVRVADKNYQLSINNLAKKIVPEKSSFKAKQSQVLLLLYKQQQNVTWGVVTAVEAHKKAEEASNKPALDSSASGSGDPNSSIMGLMKKMYDEGDDKMKQMLNKTWYETQQKQNKGGDPMAEIGGMGGFGGLGGM